MKKTIAMFLVGALAFAFVACGGGTKTDGSGDSTTMAAPDTTTAPAPDTVKSDSTAK